MFTLYLIAAALCFALGGLFMKSSQAATRMGHTIAFIALFVLGAILQARAMRQADMGIVYLAVLGLEAAAAVVLSAFVLHEQLTWPRIGAICLIITGVVLLRRL
jgi:multidrug transporter EmrE-like cation transporter